jgi:hypothetical protein
MVTHVLDGYKTIYNMILLFSTALELFFGKVEEIEVKIVFINSHVSEKIKRTFGIFIMYSTFTSEGLCLNYVTLKC